MTGLIGKPVKRKEDFRLLTGQGRFSADYRRDGETHAFVLRCPHAHAALTRIDTKAAENISGVLAVPTMDDYLADGLGPIPHPVNPRQINNPELFAFENRDGSPMFHAPFWPMLRDKARHVGEPVAFVVAESLAVAQKAAERIETDYEIFPAVTDVVAAIKPDALQLYEGAPGNLAFDSELGDAAAVEAAFASATHVVKRKLRNNRVSAVPMEPRAALAWYDAEQDHYTLLAGSQGSVRLQRTLIDIFGVEQHQIRVACDDVGGGFGVRGWNYPEFVLALWAAKRTGRPVRWCGERTECFLSDVQGRDLYTEAALALDGDGKILAMKVSHLGNVGGNLVSYVPLANGSRIITSIYDIPAAHLRVRGVITNTLPTGPYRGAGRPEAMFVIESLLDAAAAELAIGRDEIRRRNLIPQEKLPYRSPMDVTYDCGRFHDNMAEAQRRADWTGFEARRKEAAGRGRLRGIGLANYVETPVGWPQEWCEIEVRPDGEVDLYIGTQSHGQGHETSFAQVMSHLLGVPFESVNMIISDSDKISEGGGTHSDRSIRLGSAVMSWASEKIIKRGRILAAHLLEAAVEDLVFEGGRFIVGGTDRSLSLFDVAAKADTEAVPAGLRGALREEHEFKGRLPAYPTGCAIAEVEIDPETGVTEIKRWTAVDDVGRVINPMIVEGQVHGGIAQGVGQVFWEENVYDDGGQLVCGSFMDYGMPRADLLPSFDVVTAENAETDGNPMQVKGGGEAGTTPALAAAMNAVRDALSPLGVDINTMPATPHRLWRLIRDARKN